jgi:hypothetical protein
MHFQKQSSLNITTRHEYQVVSKRYKTYLSNLAVNGIYLQDAPNVIQQPDLLTNANL